MLDTSHEINLLGQELLIDRTPQCQCLRTDLLLKSAHRVDLNSIPQMYVPQGLASKCTSQMGSGTEERSKRKEELCILETKLEGAFCFLHLDCKVSQSHSNETFQNQRLEQRLCREEQIFTPCTMLEVSI